MRHDIILMKIKRVRGHIWEKKFLEHLKGLTIVTKDE